MFIEKDDPEFWSTGPEFLQAIKQQAEAYGLKVANFMMGAQQDDQAPVATVMYMPPNFVLPRHAHDCYRVEVVVQGSVDTGDRVLNVGDVMVSAPNEFYGPHTAGQREACPSRSSAVPKPSRPSPRPATRETHK